MKVKLFAFVLLVLFPSLLPAGEGGTVVPEYRLEVSFDISRSKISGIARLPVRAGREVILQTGALSVSSVEINGRSAEFSIKGGRISLKPSEDGVMEVRYEGVFKGGEPAGNRNYGVVSSTIDSRGVSLTGLWYPQVEGLAVYRLTAILPPGYEAVSEAEKITKIKKDNSVEFTFEFPHPVDGMSLVAADRYEVTEDRSGDIELFAYFFKEDRELAKTYLQYAKKYFGMYEKLLTKYPYKRFSIVENFLPTGYSMPTFTLLGQDVVRLPFIVETSLGHEVLHQWFGNSVHSDYEKGNWTEGLTTYLADHLYEEQNGKGWEYRKQMLINYGAYVNEKNEFPLREFQSRMDFGSRAIGYGKSAMVFHMLRRMTGDEQFYGALKDFIGQRQFQRASWTDLQSVFEKQSGRDLSAFFKEWIDGKGLPEISVENATARQKGAKFEVSFDVIRKNSNLALDLPVVISSPGGGMKKEVVVADSEKKSVTILADEEPIFLSIDGDYDVARKLTEAEMPPSIARLAGDEKVIIAAPETGKERYAVVIDGFRKKGAEERDAAKLGDSEIKSASLIILGRDNPVISRLFAGLEPVEAGFGITVKKNPWNPGKVAAIIQAKSADEAGAAFEKIFHYGKYSSLSFDKGKNVSKKIEPAERGIIMELRVEPSVVDLSLLKTLSNVIEAASAKKIVYVGEYHDRFSHHNVQLQIIKALHKKDGKLAIGMEMFQRPFQKTLDEYIGGAIDEREFLSRSEYFKRWGFDYNLYKPILDYAKAEKVPVVALNLRREITEKVSKEGMDSLTEEERKDLPHEMDFSDEEYRDRLKQVFEQHKGPGERNFVFFLQAQVLWDETMAQSIDEYLKKNPDDQMVVVAGGGHVVYGAGIPKRTFRRNGLSYTIILNDGGVERDIADYIVFPQPLEGPTAPRLMASFREEKGKTSIVDFVKDSVAKKAGLKAGDVVVSLDGVAVHGLQDIKLALFYKKKGDIIKISVIRKRFLLGEKEMEFEVKL